MNKLCALLRLIVVGHLATRR